ncbi:restriction endonuclease subunit S [Lactobacillus jensenii]|uniref:restriction endonuclease subunit S n=2 Tax=Lactobacillus jensenii TaxID=109790 RepID=UPI001246E218|nr:restriction endonuclease subunit S [Lactobacillus jensenii]KAA9235509.1 restriction endonuclease subunit S [Lactobacillus jensenii]MCF1777695.1 restriction endonuclease subunit S [Lactobacillus jensenii]MCW8115620.1 restriction endonuclease subunit S [Lactobacillus jensenii]MDK7256549.1 restriction endonuclease subunit S [Lactobacillus jensenii]MDX5103046.1 restriction endonuclease subunit S [Lactobacillus jensenii]
MYPKVRFRGFDEPWKKVKLGEIATTYSGGTPKAGNKKYYNGLIPFIRSGEIHSNKTELFISEAGLKNSSAKMVTKGDLLYALYGATSGEVDISKINGAINQAVLAIIPKQYNPYIISLLLSKKKDAILSKYLQGGQGNLSAEIVKSIKLILPSKNEESSLYPLFKVLDNLLSLQQRKLELENKLKKQIAFYLYSFTLTPNFKHIEVKNKKLGDIVDISNGIMGDSQKKSGNFKLTRIETISNGKIDLSRTGYIDQVSDEKKFLEVGDILYSNINSLTHIGKNAIVKEKHLPLVHGINLFRLHITNNQITPNYLHGLLNLPKYKWWVKSHANPAVNQASINKTELSSLVIKYPDLDIQNQINNINYSFAQYWDIQYSKKESLCQLKQFLLQNLFI